MNRTISPRTWTMLGAGVVVVAGLALVLAFLGREPGEPPPMITPAFSTPPDTPVAAGMALDSTPQSPLPTPFTSPLPAPTAETLSTSPVPVPATGTPYPTPELVLPEVAPEFTLERARGGAFTLSEQLAQGPVVLVFFQRGG